ncbi:MAG: hypothetical protein GY816_08395 [Cytophagales bacterium]|nr:hypothetical protein [Cytophagales bacterium]
MRKLGVIVLLISGWLAKAQDPVGEVSSEEIIIEKNKEIVLPRADKLFSPIGAHDIEKDSIRLTFDLLSPQFNISPFETKLIPYSYSVKSDKLAYQNFFKAGVGSYGSLLLSAYAGQETKKISWGTFLHHESFGTGSIRGKQSASGSSYIDVFATFQNPNWAFTPAVGWQSDGFRFYGYDDGDDRITTDKSSVDRIRIGGTLEEINADDWNLSITPTFRTTTQNTGDNAPASSERYFDFLADASHTFDSTLSAGVDLRLGAISFDGEATINRDFVKINPWVGVKRSKLFIRAGVELATTNDTIVTGTKSFFYPDISIEWSGLQGWTVYGDLSGELKPVTFSSISRENLFMDDSLVMAHENVKSRIGGGIRGAITSKLFLNSGINLSNVENMSFFMPSTNDTARFILAVEPESVTILNWYGNFNFQSTANTYLNLRADFYSYGSLETYSEAWYKSEFKLSVDWFQRYSEKISSQVRLTTLGGIKAPSPITFVTQTLDPIFDLSLEGTYQINEQAEAFLQIQNLFGKEYERFLNYPNRGVAFKIGGLYRF